MTDMKPYSIIEELLQGLNKSNVVLYVGRGMQVTELDSMICGLNWRCVVTSQTRSDFGKEFAAQQRKPKRYVKFEELPGNLFDRINLPIIQIYGTGEEEDQDGTDDPYVARLLREKNAKKIMEHIMGRLDVHCKMVVIGYMPSDPHELSLDEMISLCYELQGGTLLFFGMNDGFKDSKWDKLHEIAEKMGYIWCESSLTELLKPVFHITTDVDGDETAEDSLFAYHKSIFYKGKESVAIDTDILLRCRNFAQLLTEEVVYQRRPLGRIQQSRWYYNFLNDSAISPQWYGYLPQSDFHLKRPFEDVLTDLVRNLIAGKSMHQSGKVTPIILEGDAGSSKSITLAAVAYRVYNERINPVVYINSDAPLFNSVDNQEMEQLDELLQEIESVGTREVRTLILWDSASYRNVADFANNLARRLDNRGRRFVLVCTAYKSSGVGRAVSAYSIDEREESRKWFSYKEGVFKNVIGGGPDCKISYDGKNYYIQSTREMEVKEKVELWKKVKLYLNLEPEHLRRCRKRLEEENDIFIYFYRLVNLIRPNLEARLSNEQRVVGTYVNRQLEILGAKEPGRTEIFNPLLEALCQAGIALSVETVSALENEKEETVSYDLDRFNTCIAMLSRFKIDTPSILGIHMLYRENADSKEEFYNNFELFKLVTSDIPWVYYGEDISGNFIFRFRNTLEAEIFLRKNEIDADRQIALICEMLDYYAAIYQKQGYEDEALKRAIQRLLRMSGPNTEYPPFCQGGSSVGEHKALLEKLYIIIDKLTNMREQFRIPDADASFSCMEVTFLREYYGKLWDRLHNGCDTMDSYERPWIMYPYIYDAESFEKRLRMLKRASDLALDNINKLETSQRDMGKNAKRYIQDQINSLAVEISYCNTSMEELWNKYSEFCKDIKMEPSLRKEDLRPLLYLHQYQMLVKAINTAPTNGYAYNALFNLFEKEYERSDEARRLQLLSEVRMIADDAMTLDITNRGMNGYDTLSDHIQRIRQYSEQYRVKIDDIVDGTCPSSFETLFENMLAQNKASGITFVCQQELDNAGLDGRTIAYGQEKDTGEYVLTSKQADVCQKILDFMERPEYAQCVEKDLYALYLMLRVAWMYYNGRPMNESREAQLTYIEVSHWEDIFRICEKYLGCLGTNKRPIVTLIYAISLIQINGDYVQANRIMDALSEDVFISTARMRVPYIVCREPGIPETYSGTVLSTRDHGGFIHVDGVPLRLGSKKGIRFTMNNLGMQSMPAEKQILKNLELGLGYTGFSLYTRAGRLGGRYE